MRANTNAPECYFHFVESVIKLNQSGKYREGRCFSFVQRGHVVREENNRNVNAQNNTTFQSVIHLNVKYICLNHLIVWLRVGRLDY